jgi:hypothetical protein
MNLCNRSYSEAFVFCPRSAAAGASFLLFRNARLECSIKFADAAFGIFLKI